MKGSDDQFLIVQATIDVNSDKMKKPEPKIYKITEMV